MLNCLLLAILPFFLFRNLTRAYVLLAGDYVSQHPLHMWPWTKFGAVVMYRISGSCPYRQNLPWTSFCPIPTARKRQQEQKRLDLWWKPYAGRCITPANLGPWSINVSLPGIADLACVVTCFGASLFSILTCVLNNTQSAASCSLMLCFYRNLLSNSKPWLASSIRLYLRFIGVAEMCLCPCHCQNFSSFIFSQGCRATSSHSVGLRYYGAWTETGPCPHLEPGLVHPYLCTGEHKTETKQTQELGG